MSKVCKFDKAAGRFVHAVSGLVHADARLLPGAGWTCRYEVTVYTGYPSWRCADVTVDMGAPMPGRWRDSSHRLAALDGALETLGARRRGPWRSGTSLLETGVEIVAGGADDAGA